MNLTDYRVLTNQSLNNSSQLKLFSIVNELSSNTKYLNIFRSYILNRSNLNNDSFYNLYEVDNDDWLDTISFRVYQTPNLWWVIAIVNNISNPFEELYPGKILRILKPNYIYNILKEIKSIGEA